MTSMHATNKPFNIEKRLVYEAYKAVKSNRGAAGVDEQTIEQFEADLSGNLYKIWNRMSSGTYFPPPVRAVSIPKKSGGERILGVPTVADRVAQMVVKLVIEPILDPIFLPDSYQPVVQVWIREQKLLKNAQGLFVESAHGNGHAQAAGEARGVVDRAHGVGSSAGASVLSAFE